MVGGRSYGESQYNRAAQALRQPGSSFKLFVYLAGLEHGLTPDSPVEDKPVSVKISGGYWKPKNYTHEFLGEIPLREAVANSVNTVAVQVAQMAGVGKVVQMAKRLGVTSDMMAVPSIALGATEVTLLEMTGAYAHLAANGAGVEPYGIVEIRTRKGKLLYVRQHQQQGVVLSRSVVGMMNEMLMGVMREGTGRGAAIGRPAAGKTGTTSDYRDAWFMGYTPALATGVWVGNDDNTPMKKVTGGMLPARIWRQYMAAALAGAPATDLPTDAGEADLPWQRGEEERHEGGVELGPNFWNKLLR
jgi:penicillin-binding protein 1A